MPQPQQTDVARLVREACDSHREGARRGRVALDARVAPAVARLAIDPGGLGRILADGLSRAIACTGAGGRLSLRVLADGPHALRVDIRRRGRPRAGDAAGSLFLVSLRHGGGPRGAVGR